MGNLKDELEKAGFVPLHEDPVRPPNVSDTSVTGLWWAYTESLENQSFKDPIGNSVRFLGENFAYLVKLEFYDAKIKQWVGARALIAISQLRNKTLDPSRYRIGDESRARTLLWVPAIIQSPDCIHDNNNAGMSDKRLYVMRYRQRTDDEAELKVVLIAERPEGLVVSSSFWTDREWLRESAKQPPLYVRPNSKGCRCR